MMIKKETLLPVLISFIFYFIWAWYANSLVTDDVSVLIRTACVQGTYSAFMTLTFTTLLTWTISKMKCHKQPFLAVIPPLLVQSTLVFLVNLINSTPNIVLTILPSVFFTALYGFGFAFTLLKKPEYQCTQDNEASD